ncbi:ABC transporter ATP-binding protein [Mobilicoccus caccae]|uniref:ABC transporter ATP-binding protein n=1 Tax=Mobilicoccus caccae TaxID=1859295 RepID=A0ABQ6ISS2_9MICO|nr:ABC transporter ATP-binding protein [Mobilicoccus caccae]GMA40333.1 ABC transporter ATP-binding protein [Mobilicoccus caccae]
MPTTADPPVTPARGAASEHPAGPLLSLSGVTVRFGGITALSDVGLEVAPHRVTGLIGPNGAGKTTCFNVVCGFVRPDEGTMTWRGQTLANPPRAHELSGLGISRTLQGLGLFDRMTVLDNVMVGAERHARAGFFSTLFGLPRSSKEEKALRERAHAALADLGIAAHAGRLPGSLPYPLRKRVALARALVSDPDLLMLDEPASGLSNDEMAELGEIIRSVSTRAAVLLVEHHMDLVMSVCDHIVVLDFGKVIAAGPPERIQGDEAVQAAYLGEVADHEAGDH